METEAIMLIYIGIACFAAGVWVGTQVEMSRWIENADKIQRIERRGKLFKVSKEN